MKRNIVILIALILTTVGVVVARISKTEKAENIERIIAPLESSLKSDMASWD